MENFVIRNAVLEDREAVLAINKDAFGGRDYLPALYDRLLTSPNTKMFVLLLNNEIVSP